MGLKTGCGLAAAVVALAGCGGSESGPEDVARPGSPPPGERLSKAESRYVERLDALCKEGDELADRSRGEIGSAQGRPVPQAQINERVVKILDKSYVESDRVRSRMRRLEVPPGEQSFHRRYIGLSARLDAVNKTGRDAIARGANPRGGDLGPQRRKFNLVRKQRAALVADHGGFRYCG
ncbi:MAG: hypothetical protein M3433_06055 [Actinomycetota bacterium]|nr:hypothetical protein [Actinomycetota bacterium]MDQ3648133.1 hypothetical protein [Actinomycetota bacterium]